MKHIIYLLILINCISPSLRTKDKGVNGYELRFKFLQEYNKRTAKDIIDYKDFVVREHIAVDVCEFCRSLLAVETQNVNVTDYRNNYVNSDNICTDCFYNCSYVTLKDLEENEIDAKLLILEAYLDRNYIKDRLKQLRLFEFAKKHKVLVRICMYCNQTLGIKFDSVGLSHGSCAECSTKTYGDVFLKELNKPIPQLLVDAIKKQKLEEDSRRNKFLRSA